MRLDATQEDFENAESADFQISGATDLLRQSKGMEDLANRLEEIRHELHNRLCDYDIEQ